MSASDHPFHWSHFIPTHPGATHPHSCLCPQCHTHTSYRHGCIRCSIHFATPAATSADYYRDPPQGGEMLFPYAGMTGLGQAGAPQYYMPALPPPPPVFSLPTPPPDPPRPNSKKKRTKKKKN
ncbi:hypothetical protein MIND_00290300 [Mycena indigotica]|uniref:Uncharacterized protein n=1 Tax=Mycena indigotica TaxID=2126181 RepID=A0A8H6WCF0_9AGAR|nr:uncharacterized protein MIND_00290300 [Mycena indigotica]KAF7312752.1 hypothetical protein MIND_00290300 [Mycena indigotica]